MLAGRATPIPRPVGGATAVWCVCYRRHYTRCACALTPRPLRVQHDCSLVGPHDQDTHWSVPVDAHGQQGMTTCVDRKAASLFPGLHARRHDRRGHGGDHQCGRRWWAALVAYVVHVTNDRYDRCYQTPYLTVTEEELRQLSGGAAAELLAGSREQVAGGAEPFDLKQLYPRSIYPRPSTVHGSAPVAPRRSMALLLACHVVPRRARRLSATEQKSPQTFKPLKKKKTGCHQPPSAPRRPEKQTLVGPVGSQSAPSARWRAWRAQCRRRRRRPLGRAHVAHTDKLRRRPITHSVLLLGPLALGLGLMVASQ